MKSKKPSIEKTHGILKVLLTFLIAFFALTSLAYLLKMHDLDQKDQESFIKMQKELDSIVGEIKLKHDLQSTKTEYCSYRNRKNGRGNLFCVYGYTFGGTMTKEESNELANKINNMDSVTDLLKDDSCLVIDSSLEDIDRQYAPSIFCQPDTRKAYFPMREE